MFTIRLLVMLGIALASVALAGGQGAFPAAAETPDGPLQGTTVAVQYDADPPVTNTSTRPSAATLPPLAADGDDTIVNSTATPIDPGNLISTAAGSPESIVVGLSSLCENVSTGCTVGAEEPPVYSNASPNVASSGLRLFEVFESFTALSPDNGAIWLYADPALAFETGDAPEFQGGYFGRQRLAQSPSRGLVFWALQYGNATGDAANGVRIAVASADDDSPADTVEHWTTFDITAAMFTGRYGMAMEIHQLQVSDKWLYLSVNLFDPSDSSAVNGAILRLRLDALEAGTLTPGTDIQSYSSADSPGSAKTFSLTPVNGATTRMYFGSGTSETTFRVLPWEDDAPTPENMTLLGGLDATKDAGANLWECTGPDGTNPCAVADTRVQSGWVTSAFGGEVGFLWNSDRRPAAARPLPFVRVLVLNSNNLTVKSQPDLFTNSTAESQFAWIYPSVAINDRGHLAGTVTVTPGELTTANPQAPAMYGFIRDDFVQDVEDAAAWETFSIIAGTHGPDLNDWGTWSGAAKHAGFGNTWLLGGHVMIGGSADSNTQPQNAWVLRQRDAPDSTSLAFGSAPPSIAAAGVYMLLTVEVRDGANQPLTGDTRVITLELLGGDPGFECTNGLTEAASDGVALFFCRVLTPAPGLQIRATAGPLVLTSREFLVTNGGFDATCNGTTDAFDALAMLKRLSGINGGSPRVADPCTGDANGDETLDLRDVLAIRRSIVN